MIIPRLMRSNFRKMRISIL